ncbi:MAG: hypothetical protein K2Q45_03190 [Nitrosomonas sp.]|nr:hypothetical protein [Nitrosomonas sp.]
MQMILRLFYVLLSVTAALLSSVVVLKHAKRLVNANVETKEVGFADAAADATVFQTSTFYHLYVEWWFFIAVLTWTNVFSLVVWYTKSDAYKEKQ